MFFEKKKFYVFWLYRRNSKHLSVTCSSEFSQEQPIPFLFTKFYFFSTPSYSPDGRLRLTRQALEFDFCEKLFCVVFLWLDMSRAPMMTTRPAFGGANGFLLAVEVDWTFAKKFLFFSLFSLMLTHSSKTLWYIRARGFGWQLENKWSKWRRFTSWNSIFQTLKP